MPSNTLNLEQYGYIEHKEGDKSLSQT